MPTRGKKPQCVHSKGKLWCTRTRQWKIAYESIDEVWNEADRLLDDEDIIVFVYQCSGGSIVNSDGHKAKRRNFYGCGNFHITKQAPKYAGSSGIAYWHISDNKDISQNKYIGVTVKYDSSFKPPAPPFNEAS